jgi:hypothetical protein
MKMNDNVKISIGAIEFQIEKAKSTYIDYLDVSDYTLAGKYQVYMEGLIAALNIILITEGQAIVTDQDF